MNALLKAPAAAEQLELGAARLSPHPLTDPRFNLAGNLLIALSQSAAGEDSVESRAFWPAGTIRRLLIACTCLGSEAANIEAQELGEQARREIATSTGVLGPGPGARDLALEQVLRESVDQLLAAARAGAPNMELVGTIVDRIAAFAPKGVDLLTGRLLRTT